MFYQNVNDICCFIGFLYNILENISKQRKGDRCVQDILGIKFILLLGEYEVFLLIFVLLYNIDNRIQVGLVFIFWVDCGVVISEYGGFGEIV